MFINKNTPLNLFENSTEPQKIVITKEVSLDSKLLELILTKFPNSEISIMTNVNDTTFSENVLYNNDELQILTQNVEMARTKFNADIKFDEEFTVEQAITASRKINEWEKLINEATIDGQPLSPLEKYAVAFSLVSNRTYLLEDENTQPASTSRNIISILTSDYIVCGGFASALCSLCSRIGIPCAYRGCSVWGPDKNGVTKWENHANCIVRIEDEKYKCFGLFDSDPTWSKVPELRDENGNLLEFPFNFNFSHFLLTHEEFSDMYENIAWDVFTSKESETNKRKPTISRTFMNAESLFPNIATYATLNTTVLNPETHEVDCSKIKDQTFERIASVISNLPAPDEHFELDERMAKSYMETCLSYFAHESVYLNPEQKNEMLEYIHDYMQILRKHYKPEELIQVFSDALEKIDDSELIEDFNSQLEYANPTNHQDAIRIRYIQEQSQSKPITEPTMRELLKNILPLMFDVEDGRLERMTNIIINKHSPMSLRESKQKTQN